MKTLSIITFAFIGLMSASCATTNAPASSAIYPFHSVAIRDDAIIATFPNIGTRWIVEEAAGSHLSSYGEALTLKAGSSLRLIEHHASFVVTAQLAPTPGLKVESHFEGSSFGTTNKDTSYFIPAK